MRDRDDGWSVRANLWRGDRALGGRLTVRDGVLSFAPHALERGLGGGTTFEVPLAEITAVGRAERSVRVPRRRLVLTTEDGRSAHLLVPRLARVLARLEEDVAAAGGHARTLDDAETAALAVPEDTPETSGLMNLIFSPWLSLLATTFFVLAFLGSLGGGVATGWVVTLGVLVLLNLFFTWQAFARRRRVRAARQR